MNMYHLTPDGVKDCTARIRNCEYGGHTDNFKEAEAQYDYQMTEKHGAVATLSKPKSIISEEYIQSRPKFSLSDEKRKHIAKAGYATPEMYELDAQKDAGAFSNAITASAKDHKYGASVYVYPVEEYKDMRLFVSDDGSTGFALKSDGDIVSVYSMQDSQYKGSAYNNILTAVEQGGTKLDCFDTVLPKIYNRCGFEETERLTWDDQYMPDGWDKETYNKYNNGEPDVVMMEYTGFKPELLAK